MAIAAESVEGTSNLKRIRDVEYFQYLHLSRGIGMGKIKYTIIDREVVCSLTNGHFSLGGGKRKMEFGLKLKEIGWMHNGDDDDDDVDDDDNYLDY